MLLLCNLPYVSGLQLRTSMSSDPTYPTFEVGEVYNRRDDLHARYGGQQQGGISTPADHPLIFLFTSETGSTYGYRDDFRPDGIFWYTGEGQKGDMKMTRGNRAIRDHQSNGKELHLFAAIGGGDVRYRGQATYLSHHWEERPDVTGEMRRAIVFELAVETVLHEAGSGEIAEAKHEYDSGRALRNRSLDELRKIALARSSPSATEEERRTTIRLRSKSVKEYVFKRSGGICEGCGCKAPFLTEQGRPYLEAHHVRRLADEGPDHPKWVAALCPACHRRVHHGQDGETYNAQLINRLREIEEH